MLKKSIFQYHSSYHLSIEPSYHNHFRTKSRQFPKIFRITKPPELLLESLSLLFFSELLFFQHYSIQRLLDFLNLHLIVNLLHKHHSFLLLLKMLACRFFLPLIYPLLVVVNPPSSLPTHPKNHLFIYTLLTLIITSTFS